MKNKELVAALKSISVETRSLVCLGCGHEHDCGIHGCAILREAAERIDVLRHIPYKHPGAANKKVDDNPPLTLEELREMGGEPVYIVFDPDADGEMLKMWVLVDADCDDGDVCLENNIGGRTVYCRNEELSGMTLYRHKTEEDLHGKI